MKTSRRPNKYAALTDRVGGEQLSVISLNTLSLVVAVNVYIYTRAAVIMVRKKRGVLTVLTGIM